MSYLHNVIVTASGLAAFASSAAIAGPEQRLVETARVDDLVQLALARNPDLGELQARWQAARARADAVGRLPEPELRYEQRGVPLRRPLDLDQAESVMIGLRQLLPAPGTRTAREQVARADSERARLDQDIRRRELAAQVRRGFAEYYRAERQLRLHREHAEVTGRLVELARASYRAGRRGQQDVIRLSLELSRIHGDLAHMEPELRSARALLNLLLDRAPDAPLGPPEEIQPPSPANPVGANGTVGTDGGEVLAERAELTAARRAIEREQAAVQAARHAARWPSVMLGLDYMYMPLAHDDKHGYVAMVGLSLPWLTGGRRDEERAATHSLLAEQRALQSTRNALRYELEEARARLDAAVSQFTVIDRDIVVQARRSFEAAESAYAAGNADALTLLDALRTYLDVRLDRVRALAHVATAAADLTRATGANPAPKELRK